MDGYLSSISALLHDYAPFINMYIEEYHQSSVIGVLRDAAFLYFLYLVLALIFREIVCYGPFGAIAYYSRIVCSKFFERALELPPFRSKIQKELDPTLAAVQKSVIGESADLDSVKSLPDRGWKKELIEAQFDNLLKLKHSDWESGKVSGAVYHGDTALWDLQAEAFEKFIAANQLHPDVFPAVRKMEAEVVAMTLSLFNAPDSGVGTSTSGGTESLLLACLAAREKARIERGVTNPEMILPVTAHAAFDKAAFYFNICMRKAPIDPNTGKVIISAVKRMINSDTVLIVGSAPNFPHGIIDDIETLSELAVRYKLPLHVDACLGSFVVPFMSQIYGDDFPLFDFRLPGVTSISCDTHKYGMAPKGSSIIMYRDRKLREYQYFVTLGWCGGIYGSPTLAGSRPGALMVGCWATMVRVGKNGYLKQAKEIVKCSSKLKEGINNIPELSVIGDPMGSVVSFTSDSIDIYSLSDRMSKKGWHLSALQSPAAIHYACTGNTDLNTVKALLKDLKSICSELTKEGAGAAKGDTSALYGVNGSVQTGSLTKRIVVGFLDALYKL
ncbi:hypothetical protein CANCADRAFT_31548 [Tortispora caseinolytica NRRL Y-17796]|uniref:sphinganine-1-phosphate aldolase n=1 Tax=Tortispora caseinolytica NRRL Y-17796 TaxID=767744 RepID=A0A1E4TG69_9ASCO|nr:hypothetical protein CANCADRAFT_31548 [Tortispora caseinolytica NRRL Y-17796]